MLSERHCAAWPAAAIGRLLRLIGGRSFKGKGRIVHHWLEHRNPRFVGERRLAGGGRIACDFIVPYEAMVWLRQEEEPELRALAQRLSPGDHFVDVGAGIGLWSLTAAACVGSHGRVTAFEPNPIAHERLAGNISASSELARNIRAYDVAVSDRAGLAFFLCGSQHNLGRVVEGESDARTVCAVTLDDHLGDERVDAIKIDVEGAEGRVLRGARRVLQRWRPWICMEFNVDTAGTDELDRWDAYRQLRDLDYRCAVFGRRGRRAHIRAGQRFRGYANLLFEPAR